jgi:hypothetical protein
MAIQGQLFQTMVLMQQTILQMQSMDERTLSRKRKNDTQGDVSHMLDGWTKKQFKTSGVQQDDYDKKIRPLSEMTPDYTNFFGFVPPSLIGGIQCTTCGKKGHHFEVCLKQYTYCTHCEHYRHNLRNYPMKKLTPSELGNWLFKRQVEDDTLSQAMSHCSLNESPRDLEYGKASQLVEQTSESSQQSNQCMNPFYSSIFLSAMLKSSNAPVTFSEWICFRCDEKGHYVNKCPQRCPKDQPIEIGIAAPQSIQHSKNF